jgi:RNA polymerase sigma factor (sigma-70 family)
MPQEYRGTLVGQLRQLRRVARLEELADGELLRLFVTCQDEAAFAALLKRQGPMVLGVCRRVLHRPEDAEDAFQAVFLVLVRRAASIGQQESVGGWLYRVAYRVAMKAKISAARRVKRESRAAQPSSTAAEPGAELAWTELRPVLDEELNLLPEKYRTPLVLCYLQGKTYTEAARELGWSNGTLSGRMAHGRTLLRERLIRRGITLSAVALAAALGSSQASAAVPPFLMNCTCQALAPLIAGKATVAGFSAQVLELAGAVLRTMRLTKLKAVSVLSLAAFLGCLIVAWSLRLVPAAKGPCQDGDPGKCTRNPARPRFVKPVIPSTDQPEDPRQPLAVVRHGASRWPEGLP